MSLPYYTRARELVNSTVFEIFLMGAIMSASRSDRAKLARMWPDLYREVCERDHVRSGRLKGEERV